MSRAKQRENYRIEKEIGEVLREQLSLMESDFFPAEDEPFLPMESLEDLELHGNYYIQRLLAQIDKLRDFPKSARGKDYGKPFLIKEADRGRLEMDYGAPAFPLEGLQQFFNLNNSRRYPRLEPTGNEHYRTWSTYKDEATKIMSGLRRRGFGYWDLGIPDISKDYAKYIHFSSQGVTGCFNKLLDDTINCYDRMKRLLGDHHPYKGSAMLVPVPTYGLFLDQMRDKAGKAGIYVVTIARHENGAVNFQDLENKMELLQTAKIKPLMYYDNTPNNPTGYLRTKEETLRVADFFHKISCNMWEDYGRRLAHIHGNGFSDRQYDEIASQANILIVDDMAYSGLEFSERDRSFSFGQELCDSVTMFSLSKIGAPGMRAGMMIGNSTATENTINRVNLEQLYTEFCATGFTVDSLCAVFEKADGRDGFLKDHRRALRERHSFHAGLMECFFNGIDHVRTLSAAQKQDIVESYAAFKDIEPDTARTVLERGLPFFTLDKRPPSGFFYMLDCDNLRGRSIYVKNNERSGAENIEIDRSAHVNTVFEAFGIDIVPAHRMGHREDALKVRVSLSLEREDLFRFYDRMQDMQAFFLQQNPEYQLDLLRPAQAKLAFQ